MAKEGKTPQQRAEDALKSGKATKDQQVICALMMQSLTQKLYSAMKHIEVLSNKIKSLEGGGPVGN